ADPPREQRLSERVVGLVRAGVVEVLALEVDRVTHRGAQPGRQVQRRGAAHVLAQERVELGAKAGVLARLQPRRLELGQRWHQRLGDVLAPVGTEAVLDRAHRATMAVDLTATANASSFSGAFTPGSISTPLATSTACGRSAAIASATLSGVSPPLRITGSGPRCVRAISQENVAPVPPGTPGA